MFDDRAETGDHHDEPDEEVRDRAHERRLREVGVVAPPVAAYRATGSVLRDGAMLGDPTVAPAPEQRVRVGDEQRGTEREQELAEHLVVEAAGRAQNHAAQVTGPAVPAPERAWQTRSMRLLVARCSVTYDGKLGARLGPAVRLILCKADGSISIHSDAGAYKPLNWMNPPCTIDETDDTIVARAPKGDTLRIDLHEVVEDTSFELGVDPGLEKDGVEAELQQLLAARVAALREDFMLVRREYPTDIGPVDLLCRDGAGPHGRRRGQTGGRDRRCRPAASVSGTARP